jgi:hypothetical protein
MPHELSFPRKRESSKKTGFPRIKYGAGLVKHGMTKEVCKCDFTNSLLSNLS